MTPFQRLANDSYDLELIFAAQSLAQFAAISGVNCQRNPFVRGTPEWVQFQESYKTQLVRSAAARGKLAECEAAMDAAEPQRVTLIDRIMGVLLGAKL